MGCHVPSPCHRALQAVALTSQPWWLCFHNWGAQGDAATVRPCVSTSFCKMQCWEDCLKVRWFIPPSN